MRTKLKFRSVFIIFIGLIVASCEENTVITPKPEIIDPATTFLLAVKSDSLSQYYIAADFNGKHICCTWPSDNSFSNNFIFNNAYYKNSTGLDQMNLIRSTIDGSVTIAFYFDQGHIFSRNIPYEFSPSSWRPGEFVELQFINNKTSSKAVSGAPNDDFTFLGTTFQTAKVQVSSISDSIMTGTFHAVLKTYSGSNIVAENGSFRIKIKVVNL